MMVFFPVVLPLLIILLESSKCIVFGSVILSGGPYCSTDGGSVQHAAVPGTVISITCAVDNPSPGVNLLTWTIPSYGVSVSNVNGALGADGDQPDFVSAVNSFDNTEDTTNATLTFTAVSELDGAVVKCADETETTSSCTLYILTRPSAPTSVMCTNLTQTSLTLLWSPPDDTGGESLLLYEVTQTPGVLAVNSFNKDTLLIEVPDLEPWTNYLFTVRANNSVGSSKNNDTITCRTLPWEVFETVQPDQLQVCLDNNGTSDLLLINITLQKCPPPSPNTATTPPFDNFTIAVSGFAPVYTNSCVFNQPISVGKKYNITVAINNEGGSSEPTTRKFDSTWIYVDQSSLMAEYTELNYSIVNCTTVKNAIVSLTISESDNSSIALKDEQLYSPDYTSFDISTLLSNESYYYTLLVIAPSQVAIAAYTGELIPLNSISSNSFTFTDGYFVLYKLVNLIKVTFFPCMSVTISMSTVPSSTDSSSVGAIVGGVLGGLVFLLAAVFILVVVIIFVYKKSKSKSKSGFSPLKTKASRIHPDKDSGFIEQGKKTYHQEVPTYQDPKNIQRQQAPTGEMYTKSQKNKSGLQSGYAELQLQHMEGSEQHSRGVLTEPNEHKPTTGNVMYSVIKRDD